MTDPTHICDECNEAGIECEAELQCECDRWVCWYCSVSGVCSRCRRERAAKRDDAWLDHCERVGDEYRDGER